ncbi:Hypothetical predicted protein [Cloeon dipterum]|uniref:Uncharacterized protein n=1 Tax=Cloeon dipterum TaxID=197152 RepID=A0A8S1DUY3_9INSE|nr:Hypothetical predicted protein [Cloeon dipterum]
MTKLGACFIVLNVIASSLAAPANEPKTKIAQKPADGGASNNKLQAAPVVQPDEKNKEQKVQSLIADADAVFAEAPRQKKPADDSAFKNNLQNLEGSMGSDQEMVMPAAVLPDDKKNNKPKIQSLTDTADAVFADASQVMMKKQQISDNIGETGDSQKNQLAPSNKIAQIDVMGGAPSILQAQPQAISGENVPNPDEKKAINLKGRMPVNAENPSKLSAKSPAGNAKSDLKKSVDNPDAQPQANGRKNGQNLDAKKAVNIKAKVPEAKVSQKLAGSASEVKAPAKGKAAAQVKSKQNKVPAEKKPVADKPKQTPAESGKSVAKAENTPIKTSKIKSKSARKPGTA